MNRNVGAVTRVGPIGPAIGPTPIAVVTGLLDLDEHLVELEPTDELYYLAAWALDRQSRPWPFDDRRAFWWALLPRWPRRSGPPSTRQRLTEVAEMLRVIGHLDRSEIAEVLGFAPETVRKSNYAARLRARRAGAPEVKTFEPTREHEPQEDGSVTVGRAPDGGFPPGPLVYRTQDPAPRHYGCVLDESFGPEAHADVEGAWRRANETLNAMLANGELVPYDGWFARVRDGVPNISEAVAARRERMELMGVPQIEPG